MWDCVEGTVGAEDRYVGVDCDFRGTGFSSQGKPQSFFVDVFGRFITYLIRPLLKPT